MIVYVQIGNKKITVEEPKLGKNEEYNHENDRKNGEAGSECRRSGKG